MKNARGGRGMPVILVVGSANMDVVAAVKRLPGDGETVLIGEVSLVNGGKGANAAVAAARLGGRVRFAGAVGEDAFGRAIREGLLAAGVDCACLAAVPGGSGTAIILLDEATRQNRIMVGPGANFKISVPPEGDFYSGASALMLQLEIPPEAALLAARRAKAAGVQVVLDPAPATPRLPEGLLQLCDLISPNETELEILTGESSATLDGVQRGAAALLAAGAQAVAVKLGLRGAFWADAAGCEFFPAFQIEAEDTTAAGDAFTGALTLGLAAGLDRAAAMREALAAGALTCTRAGAQTSLPTRAELDAFLRARPAGE